MCMLIVIVVGQSTVFATSVDCVQCVHIMDVWDPWALGLSIPGFICFGPLLFIGSGVKMRKKWLKDVVTGIENNSLYWKCYCSYYMVNKAMLFVKQLGTLVSRLLVLDGMVWKCPLVQWLKFLQSSSIDHETGHFTFK
ncbi:hypothetical protein Cni_G20012 [Canna indica]|uniref:Uncharacterized protein n=1 Tax=Canna indica TaxID=4628 RepID=A0AAQ3QKB3_9LILI|nr:hypothetical protein Cni_G20012 [Canna indica]